MKNTMALAAQGEQSREVRVHRGWTCQVLPYILSLGNMSFPVKDDPEADRILAEADEALLDEPDDHSPELIGAGSTLTDEADDSTQGMAPREERQR